MVPAASSAIIAAPYARSSSRSKSSTLQHSLLHCCCFRACRHQRDTHDMELHLPNFPAAFLSLLATSNCPQSPRTSPSVPSLTSLIDSHSDFAVALLSVASVWYMSVNLVFSNINDPSILALSAQAHIRVRDFQQVSSYKAHNAPNTSINNGRRAIHCGSK